MTTDHVTAAQGRLAEQMKLPSWQNLLAAVLGPFATLEVALQALLADRLIDTAADAQLDVIGRIVGEARNGLTDDIYRRRIRARIATNRSSGRTSDLITVTRLVVAEEYLLGAIEVITEGIATVVVRINGFTDDDIADVLIDFLRDAVGAGIRVILETTEFPAEEAFILGWAATGNATIGGSAIEIAAGDIAEWPESGTATIDEGGSAETVSYTGKNGSLLINCVPAFSASHSAKPVILGVPSTLGAGFGYATSGSASIGASTITAVPTDSNSEFPASGSLTIGEGVNAETVTYTGKTSTTFTGCSPVFANTHTSTPIIRDNVGGRFGTART